MTPAKCRQLADYIAEHTYTSPVQKALVKDVRAGLYTRAHSVNPKTALLVALNRIEAPADVLQHVEEQTFDPPPTALSPAALAAAMRVMQSSGMLDDDGSRDFRLPADFDSTEWYANALLPDGAFISAVAAADQAKTQREIEDGVSATLSPASK